MTSHHQLCITFNQIPKISASIKPPHKKSFIPAIKKSQKMAMTLSASISSTSKTLIFKPLFSPNSIRLSCNRRSISRRNLRTRAKLLRDDEKTVVVEDSFPVEKGLAGGEAGKVDVGSSGDGTPGALERWAIKIEHSINIVLTDSVIKILDTLYHDRHYARFYVLETIARVPYFAFISVLHLYESCGWWRRADYLKVHFAESWNELHHLLIMEELGGNSLWFDRFLAQHIAIFYYFMIVVMYAISPRMAYHFSECVESHAFATYDKFLLLQGDELKKLPAPEVAVKYYMNEDLYMFDEFQTDREPYTRRPKIENLYDVFVNIRDDEAEHCKTMKACQTHGNLRSPHDSKDDPGCVSPQADCEGIVDCIKKSLKPTT